MTKPYLEHTVAQPTPYNCPFPKKCLGIPSQIKNDLAKANNISEKKNIELEKAKNLLIKALEKEDTGFSQKIIKPFPEETVTDTRLWSELDQMNHFNYGLSLIAQGKVAIVTLAGGQGTRLGSLLPKGCFDLGLKSKRNLFDLQAGKIERLTHLARMAYPELCPNNGEHLIKWAVMTSPATHQDTVSYFKRNYDSCKIPLFFQQGELPCFEAQAPYNVLIDRLSGDAIKSPDGNGGVFEALKRDKILDQWRNTGVKHVHIYCVDNILTRVADPCFISICVQSGVSCGIKVVEKTDPTEKVGILAVGEDVYGCSVQMVEYSELPSHLSILRQEHSEDPSMALVYRLANIASHYFSLEFLEMAATRLENSSIDFQSKILPAHIARKNIKVPGIDFPIPGLKIERFIFDILRLLPSAKDIAVMLVSREEEFSPLKNASVPGKIVDGTPESCKEALYAQYHKLFEKVEKSSNQNNSQELDPKAWYFGEPLSLSKLKKFVCN